jgi:hypothetical protein
MNDYDLTMTDLGKLNCPECGRHGLEYYEYHSKYLLICLQCDWEQANMYTSLREAAAALGTQPAQPPAKPLTTAANLAKNGNFEAAGYYAAVAQAEALARIAEVLETLLDDMAAAVRTEMRS